MLIIETSDNEDVYDITVENTHNFYANGTVIKNCGEISMPAYSLCCLGSLNLPSFVTGAFGDSPMINQDLLSKTIRTAVRFLDDVLDVTKYPLKRIEDFSKQWRRIGLGFTGFGDVCAMMKIKYGSQESIDLADGIGRILRDEAYSESAELAREKGTFPAFDKRLNQSSFITSLPEELYEDIWASGLRNIGILTCAPTGTISLTVGNNCSSGIEPIFALQYDRTIRTGKGDETRKETVYDKAWLEYLHTPYDDTKAHMTSTGLEPKIPEYFITSNEVNPYDGVRVQAAFQKYIDHSISKTANLPEGYTLEAYKDLFMFAYKQGLKGFTSFNPQGSMKGILSTKPVKKEVCYKRPEYIERSGAPKRPKDLECDIYVTSIKGQKFLTLIGKYSGSIYETFISEQREEWSYLKDKDTGIIRKKGKGNYDLIIPNGVDKVVIENIAQTFNHEYEGPTRLLSTALRHGTPIEFIVEQLGKSDGFGSWSKSLARVLKGYIKNGEQVKTSMECPSCGSKDGFMYKEGCVTCMCGWSKC